MNKPRRSYQAIWQSLRQVVRIDHVEESEALWSFGEASQEHIDSSGFKVAVWNLCKGAWGRMFEHDFRNLCNRSDIVMAQEALLSQSSLRLFQEPGFAGTHAASYKRADGLHDGVLTASRAQCSDEPLRYLSLYPEPFFKTPKAAMVTQYRMLNAKNLMVINLHATLIRGKALARREIEHLMERVPDHDGPTIFAGDFNTFTPGYLVNLQQALHQYGFDYIRIPNDPRKTMQLDHMFVRGLEPISAEIDTTVRHSDHLPLLVHLKAIKE